MKTTKQMIEVMQAYEDGKIIICGNNNKLAGVLTKSDNGMHKFNWSKYDYNVEKEKLSPLKKFNEDLEKTSKNFPLYAHGIIKYFWSIAGILCDQDKRIKRLEKLNNIKE